MKLTGNLKKQVEKAETREEARETIANAGMLLTDDELDQVSGGKDIFGNAPPTYFCEDCKKEFKMIVTKIPCPYCRGTNIHLA